MDWIIGAGCAWCFLVYCKLDDIKDILHQIAARRDSTIYKKDDK